MRHMSRKTQIIYYIFSVKPGRNQQPAIVMVIGIILAQLQIRNLRIICLTC